MKSLIYYILFIAFSGLLYSQTPIGTDPSDPSRESDPAFRSNPAQRGIDFYKQRAYPFDKLDRESRINAIEYEKAMHYKNSGNAYLLSQIPEWRPIGPFNIGGRVKSIACHPTERGLVYIGTAAGGIWRTRDYGATWEPVFDNENASAFGSLSIDITNPDIIYAATGEAASNIDSYLGAGVFKSTDGGDTWNVIGLTSVGSFSKIYVHPKDPNLVIAGAMKSGQGVWRSDNAGMTWTKVYDASISDLSINPDNPNEFVAGVYNQGVIITSDRGQNWQFINSGFRDAIGRVSVQYAPSNPSVLYCLMENTMDEFGGNRVGNIYKTTNKGSTWDRNYNGTTEFFGTNNQGFYDNYIQVHPTNENIVLAGGIALYRTINGGGVWQQTMAIENQPQNAVHVDQHCAMFDPADPRLVYIGNDGGMYKSNTTGESWIDINNDLQITQFYAMGVDVSRPDRTYGGTQDNGSLGNWLTSDRWDFVAGGDGFRMVVDYDKPDIIYGETPHGGIWKADLGKQRLQYGKTSGIPASDEGLWNSPLIMDPVESYILFHGRHAVYATVDNAENWFAMTKQYENQFSAIEVSPVNNYVIWGGTTAGELIMTSDQGEIWNEVSKNKGLPARYITDIESSPIDEGTAYITFSGYGSPHVYRTTDYGSTWHILSNGLPDVPCNAIAIYPNNPEMLFVGTDIGVFASFNSGIDWFSFGRNLPRCPVIDLEFHTNKVVLPQPVLRAATHGRSMWEIDIPTDIGNSPSITIPAGGEKYVSTTVQLVRWYGFEPPVMIEKSMDNGKTWSILKEEESGSSAYWDIPNHATINARIRIKSLSNPGQEITSNTFSISLKEKGSVLKSTTLGHIPYGIAFDKEGKLWSTSFYDGELYRLNPNNFTVEKSIKLQGDSLFTDLAIDKENNLIYIHQLTSTLGGSGFLHIIDFEGNYVELRKSGVEDYPIGIELVDGNIIQTERDAKQYVYVSGIDGTFKYKQKNACLIRYGPRGLAYDGTEFLYQVCTYFPSSGGALSDAYVIKFSKNDLSTEVDRIRLEDANGLINARGIDLDPMTKDLWVSDFGGNIYKIAGFETILSAPETSAENDLLDVSVFPNPAKEFSNISIASNINSRLSIELIDDLGRKVKLIDEIDVSPGGRQSVRFNTDGITDGIYTIVFISEGRKLITKRIAVIK